jgi:hypothetical protein
MTNGIEQKRAWCVINGLILGCIAGLVVSSIICYFQPKIYVSRALIATNEKPGRKVALSQTHAAQALRLTSDLIRPDPGDQGLVSELCEDTRITAKDDCVEILVSRTNKFDARELALEIAWLFRGMDAEHALDFSVPDPPAPTDAELELMDRRRMVESFMDEACREAGEITNFRLVPALVQLGSPAAEEVWKSESFQRHWKFHQDATWEIAGEPRSQSQVLPLVGYPVIADTPSSPNVQLYQVSGLFVGFALGGFVGFRRSLRIKPSSTPEDPLSDEAPAYAEFDPPPIQQVKPPCSEEEW